MDKNEWLIHSHNLWSMLANTFPYYYCVTDPQYQKGPNQSFWDSGYGVAANICSDLTEHGFCPSSMSACELGSGVGRVANGMSACVKEVHGYDVCPEMVTISRTHFQHFKSDIYDGSLPGKAFDFAYSVITLQHNYPDNQAMMLEDMFKASRHAVWFNLPIPTGQEFREKREFAHIPMYGTDPEDVKKLADANGFELAKMYEDPHRCRLFPSHAYLFVAKG